MNANISKNRSLLNFVLLLFGLSIPFWVIGAIYNVQLFPSLNLFQLPLAMPAVTALILIYREGGRDGVVAVDHIVDLSDRPLGRSKSLVTKESNTCL